jgi:hypothetical protein
MTLFVLGHDRITLLSDQEESRHEDRLVHIIRPLDRKKSHPVTLLVLGHYRIILLSDQEESRHEDRLVHIILPLDPKESHPMTLFVLGHDRIILLSNQKANHLAARFVHTLDPIVPQIDLDHDPLTLNARALDPCTPRNIQVRGRLQRKKATLKSQKTTGRIRLEVHGHDPPRVHHHDHVHIMRRPGHRRSVKVLQRMLSRGGHRRSIKVLPRTLSRVGRR